MHSGGIIDRAAYIRLGREKHAGRPLNIATTLRTSFLDMKLDGHSSIMTILNS